MNSVRNKDQNIKFIFSICIPLLYIFAVWKVSGIYFETNDDRFITEILSGTITGEPEAHAVYVNYLLSYPLSMLYQVSVRIPWYGGMLVLCHFTIYAALLQSIWSRKKSIVEYMFFGGLVCCFAMADIYMTSVLQYTSTAALLAVAGYTCLLLRESSKRSLLLFFAFELMAFLIRSQAMLMIQPLGAAACIGLYLMERKGGKKERCRQIIGMLSAVLLVIGLGYSGNLIGYQGKEWDDYNRFNGAGTELFDYYGTSTYEEVKPILDAYDVTRAEYEAFCNYVILDWDMSVECAEALARYAEGRQEKEIDVAGLLKQVWKRDDSAKYLNLDQVAGISWVIVLLWMLLRKRFYLIMPLGGIAVSKTVVWGYLFYRGRMPLRIANPLSACEIMLLAALFIRDYSHQESTMKQKVFPVLAFMIFAFCCFSSGKLQYHESIKANGWQAAYMQGLVEIQNYCEMNPDNRYLLDSWSFCYYRGSAFETRIYGNKNYVYSGSWFANSPALLYYLNRYFEGYDKDIYLIVYDTESTEESIPAVAFLTEKFDRKPILVDKITVSHGGSYLVWCFEA